MLLYVRTDPRFYEREREQPQPTARKLQPSNCNLVASQLGLEEPVSILHYEAARLAS
jgi:hypothetical protein